MRTEQIAKGRRHQVVSDELGCGRAARGGQHARHVGCKPSEGERFRSCHRWRSCYRSRHNTGSNRAFAELTPQSCCAFVAIHCTTWSGKACLTRSDGCAKRHGLRGGHKRWSKIVKLKWLPHCPKPPPEKQPRQLTMGTRYMFAMQCSRPCGAGNTESRSMCSFT